VYAVVFIPCWLAQLFGHIEFAGGWLLKSEMSECQSLAKVPFGHTDSPKTHTNKINLPKYLYLKHKTQNLSYPLSLQVCIHFIHVGVSMTMNRTSMDVVAKTTMRQQQHWDLTDTYTYIERKKATLTQKVLLIFSTAKKIVLPNTHIADWAQIYKLANLVFNKALMEYCEEYHLKWYDTKSKCVK